MMALKIVSLGEELRAFAAKSSSNSRPCLREAFIRWCRSRDRWGASGDLAPLAHVTAVMIGEGQALCRRKGLYRALMRWPRQSRAADARTEGKASP